MLDKDIIAVCAAFPEYGKVSELTVVYDLPMLRPTSCILEQLRLQYYTWIEATPQRCGEERLMQSMQRALRDGQTVWGSCMSCILHASIRGYSVIVGIEHYAT
jgi:hypothetical protein